MAIENTGSPQAPKTIPPWAVGLLLAGAFACAILFFKSGPKSMKGTGKLAPDIVFKDLSGKTASLSQFRGKTVLVNFWASWCGPCMEEMPELKQLEAKYAARNFMIVLINVEEKADRIASLTSSGALPSHVFVEPTPESLAPYDINSIPVSVLIGPTGEIKKGYEGPRNWLDANILTEIESLLQ